MTNKPMLSVERELLGKWASGWIKAEHHAEMRAILDSQPNQFECRDGGKCGIGGYCDACPHTKPATQHQGEPIAHLSLCLKGPNKGDYIVVTALGASGNDVWSPDIPVYAEQPAPVAVVMPERMTDTWNGNRDYLTYDKGWNDALSDVARLNAVKP